MVFNSIEEIKSAGFTGFKTINYLNQDMSSIPKQIGVYMILRSNLRKTEYLEVGTGGFFKQRNPNMSLNELVSLWLDNSLVVYIGKAGGGETKSTLRSRLGQYLSFGRGQNVGHWGGRLIWQLKNSGDLIVCWKPLTHDDPKSLESQLIKQFTSQFGKRPFANLSD